MTSESINWTRRKFIIVGTAGVIAAPLLTSLPGVMPEAKAVGTAEPVEPVEPVEKENPGYDPAKCKGCLVCTILYSNCLALNNRVCWCETAETKPA